MSIRQIKKIESQVWNSDMRDFYNNSAKLIVITHVDFESDSTDPARILLDSNGVYHINGRIKYIGAPALLSGVTILGVLPLDATDDIERTIASNFVLNDVQEDLSFTAGIGTVNNSKDFQLYGLNKQFSADNTIFLNVDVETPLS